jgi:hypothetical protein
LIKWIKLHQMQIEENQKRKRMIITKQCQVYWKTNIKSCLLLKSIIDVYGLDLLKVFILIIKEYYFLYLLYQFIWIVLRKSLIFNTPILVKQMAPYAPILFKQIKWNHLIISIIPLTFFLTFYPRFMMNLNYKDKSKIHIHVKIILQISKWQKQKASTIIY